MPSPKKLLTLIALFIFYLFIPWQGLVFADIPVDVTKPTCTFSGGGYTTAGNPPTLQIRVTGQDSSQGSSGIKSMELRINPGNQLLLTNSFPFSPPTTWIQQVYNWNTTSLLGDYVFNDTILDHAGNLNSCTTTYTVGAEVGAWIKTTQGDVHSNTRINVLGGP